MTGSKPLAPPPSTDPCNRPGRFSLREVLILVTLICLTAGLFTWARADFFYIPYFLAALVADILFTIHIFARWSFFGIFASIASLIFIGALLFPPLGHGPEPSRRMQCSNHLKQIGLALQNYHDVYQSLPPAYIADRKGRPMHSWRVLILPFMEQKPLYDRYNFNEPWDGPNNSKLHNEIVHVFCCPSASDKQPRTDTSYVAVMGPQTMWPGEKSVGMAAAVDGTSSTIMVVEVVNSGIHWMEPRDLHMVQMPIAVNPARGMGISSAHSNVALAVFVDGHTAALTTKTPPDIIRRLLTIADGEQIGDY